MELSDIFDKKFNFLRKINDEIIDNPLKDIVDDYDEHSEEDDWEVEDTEEDDWEVEDTEEESEEYTFNGNYNLSNCLPYIGSPSLIKGTLSFFSSPNNRYLLKFNDEHLNRSYFVNNISCNNNGYCSFDVLTPDDSLISYLNKKTINFFEPGYISIKDCCVDIKIEVLDSCGIKVSEVIFHNAILSTISGDGFPENECYDIKLEFNYDWFEKKY